MAVATPVPSLSDAINGYQADLQNHTADVTKQLDAAKTIYEDKLAKTDAAESALNSDALKPPTLTPPPTPKATEPVAIWGSAAMWVAAIGGLLTRRPLTNSLNAMGAVMAAYRQGDAAAAQTAFDTWKTETDNAVKMAQFSIDSYKAALAHIDTDRKAAAAEFQVTAKSLGDENMAYVLTHYGLDAAVRLNDANQEHLDRMAKAQPDIDKKNMELQLSTKLLDAQRKLAAAQRSGNSQAIADAQAAVATATADKQAMTSGGDTGLSTDAVNEMAQQYIAGDKTVLSGLGYGKAAAASRIAVRNKIAELMAQQNIAAPEMASRLATFDTTAKAFATRAQGNAVRSFGVLLSHFDTLKKVYAALKNGDTRGLSALKNSFETEFGYPAPTNVDAARQIIGDEIVKAVTGAAGALGDRETAQQTISLNSSPDQMSGLLDTYGELAVGQLKGLRQQYTGGTGLSDKDFEKLLSPAAKARLHAAGDHAGGDPTAPTDAELASAPHIANKAQFDAFARKGHGLLYYEPDGALYRTP